MNQAEIIQATAAYVRQTLEGEGSGHDWWHIVRVWNLAKRIGAIEGADPFVVELAALLHDIADWKFHDGDLGAGARVARVWLEKQPVPKEIIVHICDIVEHVSYKGAGVATEMATLEGKIVQDADRLDAIGAIGIARTFAYGGHKNREMYNPEMPPTLHQSFEEYKNSIGTTINHFYEKLLLLKDRMNTATAKQIALERHQYMKEYLERFYKEWNGNL